MVGHGRFVHRIDQPEPDTYETDPRIADGEKLFANLEVDDG